MMYKKVLVKNKEITAGKLFFLSVVLCFFLTGILWAICPIHFGANDDLGFLCQFAGYQTGQPIAGSIFTNYSWSLLVTSLYRLCRTISWYPYIYMFLILISVSIVCFDFLYIMNEKKIPLLAGLLFFSTLFICVLCFHLDNLQFTTTPGLCGMACLCNCIILTKYDISRNHKLFIYISSGILSFFAICIREMVGYLFLLSFIIMLICLLIQKAAAVHFHIFSREVREKLFERKTEKRNIFIFVCIILFVFLFSFLINNWYRGTDEYINWKNSNTGGYLDYPHLDYEEGREVYEKVGWSESLYNLINKWYLLDEKSSTDNFSVINASYKNEQKTFPQVVQNMVTALRQAGGRVLFEAAICIIILFFLLKLCDNRKLIFSSIVYIAVFGCLSLWLAYQGRIPDRVVDVLIYLYLIPALLYAIDSVEKNKGDVSKKMIIVCSTLLLTCAVPFSNIRVAYIVSNEFANGETTKALEALWNYGIENKNNMYIYDYTLAATATPFINFKNGATPNNVAFWGPNRFSPVWRQQLESNGKNEFYTANLMDDDVFYVSSADADVDLISYMREEYPESKCSLVEQTNYFTVYKFSK